MKRFTLRDLLLLVAGIGVCCACEVLYPGFGGAVSGCVIVLSILGLFAWRDDQRMRLPIVCFVITISAVNAVVFFLSFMAGILGVSGRLADTSLNENRSVGLALVVVAIVAITNTAILLAPPSNPRLRPMRLILGANSVLVVIGILYWHKSLQSIPSFGVIALWTIGVTSITAVLLKSLYRISVLVVHTEQGTKPQAEQETQREHDP